MVLEQSHNVNIMQLPMAPDCECGSSSHADIAVTADVCPPGQPAHDLYRILPLVDGDCTVLVCIGRGRLTSSHSNILHIIDRSIPGI